MKPAPIYLLLNGAANGPHTPAEVFDWMWPDEEAEPREPISEQTLACIEGMKGWRPLAETLIYAYAKLLPAVPQAEQWIQQGADRSLDLRDGKGEIRKALKKSIGLEDWGAAEYIWQAIDTNIALLDHYREYQGRISDWNEMGLEEYPIKEFIPFNNPPQARDWAAEWLAAGGQSLEGRMLARADDPCWIAFSDFELPFSPFSFGRDGYFTSVSAAEANGLGLLFVAGPVKLKPLPAFKMVGA